MNIAESIWLRGQTAQTNLFHIASYNTAFISTATLQAWQMSLKAPACFWSAMARVGAEHPANSIKVLEVTPAQTAEIVQMVPVVAPAPDDTAPVAKTKPADVTLLQPAPIADAPAPIAKPKPVKAAKPADIPKKPAAVAVAPISEAVPEPKAEKSAPEAVEPVKAKPAKAEAKPAPNPMLLDEPRGGKADDLKVLDGIGPKLETALNEFGIYHFDQIAGLNDEGIAWLNTQQKGFSMTAERFDLVGQAKAKLAN